MRGHQSRLRVRDRANNAHRIAGPRGCGCRHGHARDPLGHHHQLPREEQAKAIGTWAGFAGAGGIIGLFVSAAIIDNATWPWVFALPIALAAVSFALTASFVPHSVEHTEAGFDVAGSLLSVVAVGGLVLAFHEGPEKGWTATITLAAIVAGLAATVAFVAVELRRDHPLLDVRIFALRGLAAGSVNLFVVFAVMFSLFLVLVQYLQAILGYSALKAASGLLPMAVMMMPLSTIAPTIAERFGFRRTLVTGMLAMATGLVVFAVLADPQGGYLTVLPGTLILGAGVGLAMSPSTAAITSSLPEEKQGVASSLNDTVREMGGAVGIALIGSVLNAAYQANVEPATAGLPPEVAHPRHRRHRRRPRRRRSDGPQRRNPHRCRPPILRRCHDARPAPRRRGLRRRRALHRHPRTQDCRRSRAPSPHARTTGQQRGTVTLRRFVWPLGAPQARRRRAHHRRRRHRPQHPHRRSTSLRRHPRQAGRLVRRHLRC
ncbi:MAG: MFS transporter [Acidimicrobiia bacterium]|nr:MFS transporter [Acidimicrobiia bacterium]